MFVFLLVPSELLGISDFAFLEPWSSHSPMWPPAAENALPIAPVRIVPNGNFGPV